MISALTNLQLRLRPAPRRVGRKRQRKDRRFDPTDPDLRHAAERETHEEVGLDLSGAESLGRLDDLHGQRSAGVPSIMIAAFVYHLPETPVLSLNHEVQNALWFPLQGLHEATRHVAYSHGSRLGRGHSWPRRAFAS